MLLFARTVCIPIALSTAGKLNSDVTAKIAEFLSTDDKLSFRLSGRVPTSDLALGLPPEVRAHALNFESTIDKVNLALAHSPLLSLTLRKTLGLVTDAEAVQDFVQFNGPELDEALAAIDIGDPRQLVAAVSGVAFAYRDCLGRKYCKFMPRGLRSLAAIWYGNHFLEDVLSLNGQVNDEVLHWSWPTAFTCSQDDLAVMRGVTRITDSVKLLAKDGGQAVMVQKSNGYPFGAYTLLPLARMIIRGRYLRATQSWTVELWHADSNEPQILYSGQPEEAPSVAVELSPDQTQVLVLVTARDENGNLAFHRYFAFYIDYRRKSEPLLVASPVREPFGVLAVFEDATILGGEELEDRCFDRSVFRPLPVRQADLLAACRTQVGAIPFTENLLVLNPQQDKLRRVYDAIQSSDDVLLPLIQVFIKGRALQSRVGYTMNKAVEKLIRNTLQGDREMFQLSAQDLWNAGIHRA